MVIAGCPMSGCQRSIQSGASLRRGKRTQRHSRSLRARPGNVTLAHERAGETGSQKLPCRGLGLNAQAMRQETRSTERQRTYWSRTRTCSWRLSLGTDISCDLPSAGKQCWVLGLVRSNVPQGSGGAGCAEARPNSARVSTARTPRLGCMARESTLGMSASLWVKR